MKWEADTFVLLAAICGVVFISGYPILAVGLAFIAVFGTAFSTAMEKRGEPKGTTVVQGMKIHGAEVLEPIVIETTRGPPFRIPSKMDIRIKPTWRGEFWFEKAAGRGMGGLSRTIYRALRGGT